MTIEKFQARVDLLKTEHVNAMNNVSMLKEQLAKSEAHIHLVSGHLNEANFHLQELVNAEAQRQGIAPTVVENQDGGEAE